MVDKEQITQLVAEKVAPRLRAHGGDIQVVAVEDDGTVKVELKGACQGCPGAMMTLKMVVEQMLRQAGADIKEVVSV
jgi:Fe-S cluster biogenesis protein NfuA